MRFSLYFIKVNNLAELDQFELPNIQEIIRSPNKKSYFGMIDLRNGYFK